MIGGWAFDLLGMPAGWLTGAMLAVTVLALRNHPLALPQSVNKGALFFLGLSMSSAITPQALVQVTAWPVSMAGLVLAVPAMVIGVSAFLRYGAKWDRATAFFAAAPGALSIVMALAMDSRADVKRVALSQTVRLGMLILVAPSLISLSGAPDLGLPMVAAEAAILPALWQYPALILGGLAGGLLFQAIRFPAGLLTGSLVAGTLLYASGLVGIVFPVWLVNACLAVLGAAIGIRFIGADLALFRAVLPAAFGALAVAMGVSAIFALAVAQVQDMPLGQLLLAYIPGAFEAMVILAFSLDYDPAFVLAHHFARFLGISLLLPFFARRYMALAGEQE